MMKVSGVNNYSNKFSKAGALAGTAASAAYLLRKPMLSQYSDVIKTSVEKTGAKMAGYSRIGLTAAVVGGILIGAGALIGKVAGKIADKAVEKKQAKVKQNVANIMSQGIKNVKKEDIISVDDLDEYFDDLSKKHEEENADKYDCYYCGA